MKIGSCLQYECPDSCPGNCQFAEDFSKYGQSAICGRCPVFVCKEPDNIADADFMPLVCASKYRDDWASEWHEFFKHGEIPTLKF